LISASDAQPGPVVITAGDPAGIGPDLVLGLPEVLPGEPLVVLGDRDVLSARAEALGLSITLHDWQRGGPIPDQGLAVFHHDAGAPVTAGRPDPASAPGTLALLDEAARGCMAGDYAAMVTAPLAKSVIRDGAAADFTGHTEYLAEKAGVPRVVMMLLTEQLRVALVTTHLPLRAVADAVTTQTLTETIEILHRDLRDKFAIDDPRILVLGLNPHAGESGHLGREEIDTITPALDRLRGEGLRLNGPVPADTAFSPELLEQHDAVLAMYHDQGLPVLKYAGFGRAVNLTLGLPFIRTSVDHGTAGDLAGTGRARGGSLEAATRMALDLARRSHA
jgi:4-hydroxythreonine-4-phosphate dehydrogenase